MRRRRLRFGGGIVAILVVLLIGRSRLLQRAPIGVDLGSVAGGRIGPCTVLRVVDGDTLHVRIATSPTPDERVRLLRIDTPERGDAGYERATACLLGLVSGKSVELEWETAKGAERDEYGRLLAYVWVGPTLANEELVRQGCSRFFTKYGGGRMADRFRAAESEARAAKRGLWNGWR